MTFVKYWKGHDPDNEDALTVGERRQLHNLLSSILFSLNNIDKHWMYTHAFVYVHPHNASIKTRDDKFAIAIYSDSDDDPENKMIGTLQIRVDSEQNKFVVVAKHFETAFDDTDVIVGKAWYRGNGGYPNHRKTASLSLSKIVDFGAEFIHKVLTAEPLH